MKRRNELNMKPAAVIHMLSPRNFKIGSYTRSPHVGGLATVSRHPAVVHAGGVSIYIYVYVYVYGHDTCHPDPKQKVCMCRHKSPVSAGMRPRHIDCTDIPIIQGPWCSQYGK